LASPSVAAQDKINVKYTNTRGDEPSIENAGGWAGGKERGKGGGREGGREGGSAPKIVLGRQDYRVAAVDAATGALSWNVSFAVINVHVHGVTDASAPGAAVPGGGGAARRPVRMVATRGGAVHCVDMHSQDWLWTSHLSATAVRAFATGGQAASPASSAGSVRQAVEVQVLASTAAQDKHFEDQFSLQLRASDYQYVAVSNGQVYATGAAIAAPQPTPLLPAAPQAQLGARGRGREGGGGGGGHGGDGGRGGLMIWEPEAGHACVQGSDAFPTCLTGIHHLVPPAPRCRGGYRS